jgi:hypothetical protein
MATILDEWRPGDLVIDALRFCGVVGLVGGSFCFFSGFSAARLSPLKSRLTTLA